MSKQLFAGNLSYNTTEGSLMQAFAQREPARVRLPVDEAG